MRDDARRSHALAEQLDQANRQGDALRRQADDLINISTRLRRHSGRLRTELRAVLAARRPSDGSQTNRSGAGDEEADRVA